MPNLPCLRPSGYRALVSVAKVNHALYESRIGRRKCFPVNPDVVFEARAGMAA